MAEAMTPRQRKLRSSCDACGSAKLKCDRGQPECGRCVSLGLKCVYGFSRKSGKPPREKQAMRNENSSLAAPGNEQSVDMEMSSFLGDSSGSGGGGFMMNYGTLQGFNNLLGDGMDNNSSGIMTGIDAPDSYGNLFAPSLDLEHLFLTNQHGGNQLTNELATAPRCERPGTGDFSIESTAYQLGNTPSIDNPKAHDCPREAYSILGKLSFLNLNELAPAPSQSISGETPASGAAAADNVPLDIVLRLTRDASERLGKLLHCSCARSPHLAMLYASILSRILIWYQQAAGCTQSASWSPAAAAVDTALHSASSSTSVSTFSSEPSSIWSNAGSGIGTGGGASNSCTPTMIQATGVAVAPTEMAIGSFNIDDQSLQTELRKQLVLSEMKRLRCVIDLFAAQICNSAHGSGDICYFGGVDSLYQSLSSWLRGEHSRILGIMKSKLSEANDKMQQS